MWRMEKCFGLTLESATKIFSVLCILESLTMIFFSIITVLILSTVQGIEETVIWLKNLFNIVTEMETPAQEASFVDSVVSCSYANIVILVPEKQDVKFVRQVLLILWINFRYYQTFKCHLEPP